LDENFNRLDDYLQELKAKEVAQIAKPTKRKGQTKKEKSHGRKSG
jgi:hypothetical protein